MASAALQPLGKTSFQVFKETQFGTTPRPPPANLTLIGKIALVTGSNVGIGLETCRLMLQHGVSHLIMATRTISKGEAAAAPLQKSYPEAKIDVWPLEMTLYESIREFAKRCDALPRLDIAILNAGFMCDKFRLGPTGREETIQINYLSTVLLSILLLPSLRCKDPLGDPGRLCLISSNAALQAKFPTRDAVPLLPMLDEEHDFEGGFERYCLSKLLVLMFLRKISEVVPPELVVVNAVDPGLTSGSALHRNMPWFARLAFGAVKSIAARRPEHAAWLYLDAVAVKGKESHGGFIVNWKIYPFHDMMYTPKGGNTTDQLWKETLKELEFAGVQEIVDSLPV